LTLISAAMTISVSVTAALTLDLGDQRLILRFAGDTKPRPSKRNALDGTPFDVFRLSASTIKRRMPVLAEEGRLRRPKNRRSAARAVPHRAEAPIHAA